VWPERWFAHLLAVRIKGTTIPIAPISKARWMHTQSDDGSRTNGTVSVPLTAMSMCSTWPISRALCSVSMTSQSNPACDRSSATFGLPSPMKHPIVDSPAFSFSLTQFFFMFAPKLQSSCQMDNLPFLVVQFAHYKIKLSKAAPFTFSATSNRTRSD
jgi:hypothetical protein